MSTKVSGTNRIAVGDSVAFAWSIYRLRGRVVEDRGNIGVKGQRLLRIHASLDPRQTIDVELPEEMLERVSAPARLRALKIRPKRKL